MRGSAVGVVRAPSRGSEPVFGAALRCGARVRALALIAVLAVLAACTVQLAPAYDRSLVDDIEEASEQAMELFASASAGTQLGTFAARETSYNKVIGAFDALVIRAGARQVPDAAALEKVNKELEKRGIPALEGDIPSIPALELVSKTVTKMRDTDKLQGVRPMEAQAVRGEVVISIDQALTYEKLLERGERSG